MTRPDIVLASTSPFRARMLADAGLAFTTSAPAIDERALDAGFEALGMSPEDVALALARAKALDVSARNPDALVIGCDQTLSLGERIFHKPKDRAEAANHLRAFSGRTHQLNSAVVLVRAGQVVWSMVKPARISVRRLSEAAIARYLDRAGDAVLKSVGAYQVEGLGVQLFEAIDGDHFTIVGLPLIELIGALRRIGALDE